MRAAVLTVSDGVSSGAREDRSGDLLAELLAGEDYEVERRDVVFTTGGTGVAPRDVTPEATLDVVDRVAPGIAEAVRADSMRRTPHGLLSRGAAGLIGSTLVVNLPGSRGGCRDGFEVLRPALAHAVELLRGKPSAHRQT